MGLPLSPRLVAARLAPPHIGFTVNGRAGGGKWSWWKMFNMRLLREGQWTES